MFNMERSSKPGFSLAAIASIVAVGALMLSGLPTAFPSTGSSTVPTTPVLIPLSTPSVPTSITHVVLIEQENTELSSIQGKNGISPGGGGLPAEGLRLAPYQSYLWAEGGGVIVPKSGPPLQKAPVNGVADATSYYAVCHPSAPEYLAETDGIISDAGSTDPVGTPTGYGNQCGSDREIPSTASSCPGTITVGKPCTVDYANDNLFEQINAAYGDSKTVGWTNYIQASSLNCGETATSPPVGPPEARHDPAVFYSGAEGDLHGTMDGSCSANVQEFPSGASGASSIACDFDTTATQPAFVFVKSDGANDGTAGTAIGVVDSDKWLRSWLPMVLNGTSNCGGTDGAKADPDLDSTVFFLTYDESVGLTSTTDLDLSGYSPASPYYAAGSSSATSFVNPYCTSYKKASHTLCGGQVLTIAIAPGLAGGGQAVYSSDATSINMLFTIEWLLGLKQIGTYGNATTGADNAGTAVFPVMCSLFGYNPAPVTSGQGADSQDGCGAEIAAPIAAPSALTVGSTTSTTLPVSWTNPTGSGYTGNDVFLAVYDAGCGLYTLGEASTSPITSYTLTGLTSGTTYCVQVEGVDGGQTSYISNTVTTQLSATTPPAVTALTANPVYSDEVDLYWTPPSSGAIVNYTVEQGSPTIGTNDVFTNVAMGGASSYSTTSLSAGTTYQFNVWGWTSAGAGTHPTAISTTTPTSTVPTAPTGLSAGTPTSSSIPLSWTNPTGYNLTDALVFYEAGQSTGCTASNSAEIDLEDPNSTYTITSLNASTTYCTFVEVVNGNGNSTSSSTTSATTAAAGAVPSAPTGVGCGACALAVGVQTLNWTNPTGTLTDIFVLWEVTNITGGTSGFSCADPAVADTESTQDTFNLTVPVTTAELCVEVEAANSNGLSNPSTAYDVYIGGPPVIGYAYSFDKANTSAQLQRFQGSGIPIPIMTSSLLLEFSTMLPTGSGATYIDSLTFNISGVEYSGYAPIVNDTSTAGSVQMYLIPFPTAGLVGGKMSINVTFDTAPLDVDLNLAEVYCGAYTCSQVTNIDTGNGDYSYYTNSGTSAVPSVTFVNANVGTLGTSFMGEVSQSSSVVTAVPSSATVVGDVAVASNQFAHRMGGGLFMSLPTSDTNSNWELFAHLTASETWNAVMVDVDYD